MAEPFIGEIRLFPYQYAPLGWAYCDGTEVQVMQYQALYAVIGNIYGGTPGQTFKLPNLQGMVPVGFGTGNGLTEYDLAETGGNAAVTLTTVTVPPHDHTAYAAAVAATDGQPQNTDLFALPNVSTSENWKAYHPYDAANSVQLNGAFVQPAGGSQPHENRQPYLALGFCIATEGDFPVRPQ